MLPDTPRVYSRLDLLYTITRELNAAGLDIDKVLSWVLSTTVATVGATDASLFLFDTKNELENYFYISNFEVEKRSRPVMEAVLEQGLAGWVKKHQEAVLIEDTSADERWYVDDDYPEHARVGSAVALPIKLPDQLIGVLTITASQPDFFDQGDVSMLTIIADQAAFAITNARLFKAEQHQRQTANTLTSIAQTINSTLNLNEVFNLILEQLALVIEYDSSSIFLRDDNGETFSVRAARGFEDMQDALSISLNIYDDIPNADVVFQQKPVIVGDVEALPTWKKSSSTQKVRSWIGAPLTAYDKVIGMLTVDSYEVNKYTEEDTMVVATFADQAATAVANAQAVALLKNTQATYTTLFENSTDLIVITNYQGLILNVNRRACQILRRTKEALIGNDINFVQPQLRAYLIEQTKRLKVWRETSIEIEVLDAYRQTIPLELKARQVYYDNKDCVAWVGRDISDRKAAERLREDLVNMLIHDLRGPLGNLINTIELLPMLMAASPEMAAAADNPTLRNLLEMAKHNGQVVRDLIDSMLDVSRLERGEVPLQRSLVDIDTIIQSVKEQVTPRAEIKEMELTVNPLPEIPPLWIDGGMIRRVLINLLDNAIKYTPNQGKVSLTTSLTDDKLTFAIADNGPGISKTDQAHIFEKFSRVDHFANELAGVGLGLAFCKLAAEAHEGQLWVESEGIPGKGSTFYFSLPLVLEPKNKIAK